MKTILEFLKKEGACAEGYKYSLAFDSPKNWWDSIDRGDWMLWCVGNLSDVLGCYERERRRLGLVTCQCSRLALVHVKDGETIPLKIIELVEAWANGGIVTLAEVRQAADDADDAYTAAYTIHDNAAAYAAAIDAAYAVACAADAAYAAYAAIDASCAAAYAYADDVDAAMDARRKTLKQCADIVRKYYSIEEIETAINKRMKGE